MPFELNFASPSENSSSQVIIRRGSAQFESSYTFKAEYHVTTDVRLSLSEIEEVSTDIKEAIKKAVERFLPPANEHVDELETLFYVTKNRGIAPDSPCHE